MSTSLLALVVGTKGAQLDLLTPREAVQVVGLIPEVAEVRKQGFCPLFSANYGDLIDKLGVQVRYGCGPYTGQWIATYEVDLRTGAAFQLESKEPVQNPEGDALAKTLVKQASARVLSSEETRCLALEAARSLPGWGGPGHDVSVEQVAPFDTRFRARLRAHEPPLVAERLFTVDRTTAHVHDDETGMESVSSSLASLVSKMLALHVPSLLSEADVLDIARQVPEVRAQALKPCSIFSVGGPLSWEDIYVTVQSHCEGAAEASSILVAVNPETGEVTDPMKQMRLGGSEAERIARARIAALEREKTSIRESVNAVCRPQ